MEHQHHGWPLVVITNTHVRHVAAFVIAVGAVSTFACNSDRITSNNGAPESALASRARGQPPGTRAISREKALTNRMPSRDSINQCFVTEIDRSTARPKSTYRTVKLHNATVAEKAAAGPGRVSASRDTGLTARFFYIRVDDDGKTTLRANCTIPNAEAAYAAAVNRFSMDGYQGPKALHRLGHSATPRGDDGYSLESDDDNLLAEGEPSSESKTNSEAENENPAPASYLTPIATLGDRIATPISTRKRGMAYDCYFDEHASWVECGDYECGLIGDDFYNCGDGCFISPNTELNTEEPRWTYYEPFIDAWIIVWWDIVGYELSCEDYTCDGEIPEELEDECESLPILPWTTECDADTAIAGETVYCLVTRHAGTILLDEVYWSFRPVGSADSIPISFTAGPTESVAIEFAPNVAGTFTVHFQYNGTPVTDSWPVVGEGAKPDSVPYWNRDGDTLFVFQDTVFVPFPPNCPPNYSGADAQRAAQGWCYGFLPTDTVARRRIDTALTRMRAKGGLCDTLGRLGQRMLALNRVKLLRTTSNPNTHISAGGQASRIGGDSAGFLWMNEMWTSLKYDSVHVDTLLRPAPLTGIFMLRDLQSVLAEELAHLHGKYHMQGEELPITAASILCDDISFGLPGEEDDVAFLWPVSFSSKEHIDSRQSRKLFAWRRRER